jgi:mRNA interferase RelE/StbE
LSYRLFFQPRAEKALLKAPRDMQARLREAILALAESPRPHGAKKLKGERDTWRVRVGDWRVVYVPNDDAKAVIVTVIGHRREVYE